MKPSLFVCLFSSSLGLCIIFMIIVNQNNRGTENRQIYFKADPWLLIPSTLMRGHLQARDTHLLRFAFQPHQKNGSFTS